MTKSNSQSLPPSEVLRIVCRALDDKKAEDLRILDVSAQSSITDHLVLATGTSEPHLRALRVELEKVLDAAKIRIVGMDTEQGSGWLVVDAFDVMVHLFTRQTRELYRLETLWKDALDLPLAGVLEGRLEPKAPAAPVKRKTAPAKKAPKAAAKKAVKKPAKKAAKKPAAKKAKPAKRPVAKKRTSK
jgi:ribosome-associated protein